MNYSEIEREILKQWNENKTFHKQIEQNKNNKTFVFYDGPPFATGLPHYGHLVASTIKDIIPRYWSMMGYNVPRRWGWDCIAEGSMINLSDGTSVRIEKFDFLANVETYNTEKNIFEIQNKKVFMKKGKKDCISLEFSNQTNLICTPEHQIYTTKGWKKAEDLSINDDIIAGNINPCIDIIEKHWEHYIEHVLLSVNNFIVGRKSASFCRLLGYFLSRGNNFDCETDAQLFMNDYYLVFRENIKIVCYENCFVEIKNKFLENIRVIPRFFMEDKTPGVLKQELLAGLLSGFKNNDETILWEGKKFFDEIVYFFTYLGVDIIINTQEYKIIMNNKQQFFQKIGYRYSTKRLPIFNNVKLISKKECGQHNVYDISVNETHTFLANGIVVHNCHGLPIEFEIEKTLGIKTKSEVLKLGIEKYNKACKSIVMKYSKDWVKIIPKLGRWVDMENDYKTMDISFMNKVWEVFHQLWEKNLIYQGVKVMPYSTGCSTPLSNFEAKLDYRKVQDPSIIVKFQMKNTDIDTFFLVWTTTPWTLISNLALCVHPDYEYAVVDFNNCFYILLKDFVEKFGFKDIIKTMSGKELVNIEYIPLFNYFPRNTFKIIADNYVSKETGTGIVHQAPAFGEDDYRVCLENGIIDKTEMPPCPFDANGYFTKEIDFLSGIYFKDADKFIIKELKNNIFKFTTEHHDYPFCWRSGTPLMYRIVPSIFVNVEKIKDKIVEINSKETNWVPEHIKEGRFGNWLRDAKDWCISRNRYWGTPIPIWKSNDGEILCVKNVIDLQEITGNNINDIHREFIDKIEINKNGKIFKRIEEVFDCWFESGSMPFTMENYPADFIAEGLDQTRGWFYTLMVLGVALKEQSPYKNVIVNGLVLAEDGEKMSKSKKNYPDPELILDKYGADALRLYLISQGIVRGESMKFREDGVKMIIQNIHIFSYNTLNFLKQMIPFYEQKYLLQFDFLSLEDLKQNTNIMDQMILSYLQEFIDSIHQEMKIYNLNNIVSKIEKFIGQLSRTYLNMNKSRLKSLKSKEEALLSLNVLFYVFKTFSIMIAPFTPFMAEKFYQELRFLQGNIEFESVHLERLPEKVWDKNEFGQNGINLLEKIIEARGEMRNILKSSKKPIKKQVIYVQDWRLIPFLEGIEETLLTECNTMEYEFSCRLSEVVTLKYDFSMQLLGKRFRNNALNVKNELEKFLAGKKVESGKKIIKINGKEEEFDEEIKIISVLNKNKIGNLYSQFYLENGLLILSDLTWNDEMNDIYVMKKIIREIMNLRKRMGMVPTDSAKILYKNNGKTKVLENNLYKLFENTNMEFEEYNGSISNKLEFEDEDNKYEFTLTKIVNTQFSPNQALPYS